MATQKWVIDATKAGSYTLNTAGTFVDRNIEVAIPAQTTGTTNTGTEVAEITAGDAEQYINISTGFQDSAKYWKINPASSGTAAELSASATGSATISTVSVGTKSGGNYPVTGSASISGTASAATTASGYATKDTTTATGSTSGTANVNASIPAAAATVTFTGTATAPTVALDTANDNVSVDAITTTKPTSGYYAAVKATAPATTLSATTKTVGTKGYLGDAAEITASAATTAKTGANYYIPITAGAIGVSDSPAPEGYTENTSAIVPTAGSLTIDEGYYPKTYIKLATLVPNEATITNNVAGASTIRTGTSAYDKDGNLITGTMGNASVKSGNVTATAVTPSYNSESGKFDVAVTATAAAPTVASAGYIDSSTGTKTANSSVSSSATLDMASLSATRTSGELTKAPTIVRTAKPTSDTWTDGASGAQTTTKPTSGVYVQVDAAASTNTLKVKPQVASAGYADTTNYGYTEFSGTVGAAKATTTYVPIKSGAKGNISATASATANGITITAVGSKPSSGYYIDSKADASMTAGTAGWIDTTAATASQAHKYYTLPTAGITGALTATSSNADYTAPTLATSAPASGPYVTLVGKGTGSATGVVSTSTTGSATRYIPIYGGAFTVS